MNPAAGIVPRKKHKHIIQFIGSIKKAIPIKDGFSILLITVYCFTNLDDITDDPEFALII